MLNTCTIVFLMSQDLLVLTTLYQALHQIFPLKGSVRVLDAC